MGWDGVHALHARLDQSQWECHKSVMILNLLTCTNSMRREKRGVSWNMRGVSSPWHSIGTVFKFSVLVTVSMTLPLRLALGVVPIKYKPPFQNNWQLWLYYLKFDYASFIWIFVCIDRSVLHRHSTCHKSNDVCFSRRNFIIKKDYWSNYK